MASDAKIVFSAVDQTSGAFRTIQSNLAGVSSKALLVGATLSGLGVTGALAGLISVVRASNDAVDALNDLKDATGASIENISALEGIALRTGTSFDTVGNSLVKFNMALGSTEKEGSDAGKVLKALGLDAKALRDMDPAEALRLTAVALSQFADDGNKARATQELFGKSLKEVAPFLKDLAEAGQLQASVTTRQAEEAEKFNKELFKMQAALSDAGRSIADPMVSGMNALIERFRLGKKEGDGFIVTLLKQTQIASLLGKSGPSNGYTDTRQELERLTTQIDNAGGASARPNDVGMRSMVERQRALRAQMDGYLNGTGGAGRGMGGYGDVPKGSLVLPPEIKPAKSAGGAGKDLDSDFKSYLENLNKQVQKTEELTTVEKLLDDIRRGALTVNSSQQAQLESLAAIVDKEKELVEVRNIGRAVATASGDAVLKANKEYQDLITSLLSATPTAQLEKQRAAMAALAQEYEAGRISVEQFNEAATTYLGNTQAEIRDGEAEDNKRRVEGLSASISEGLLDGFRNGKSLADIFLNELKAQFAKTVLQPLITPIVQGGNDALTGALKGGSGGGLGSLLGGIAGIFGGSATAAFSGTSLGASGFGSGLAYGNMDLGLNFDGGGYTGNGLRTGGMDGKGGFMAMLHPQETVVDHTKGQKVGGSSTVVNNYTFGGGVSRSEVVAGMQQVLAQARTDRVEDGRRRRN